LRCCRFGRQIAGTTLQCSRLTPNRAMQRTITGVIQTDVSKHVDATAPSLARFLRGGGLGRRQTSFHGAPIPAFPRKRRKELCRGTA
jgi:hypothetical protein